MAKPVRKDNPWLDWEFEEKVFRYFHERVPKKVFDAHFHISKREIPDVPDDEMLKTANNETERMIGTGKLKGGLVMGNPYTFSTQERYEEERRFSCENACRYEGFVTGLIVRPQDGPEDVEKWLLEYPRIVALKVYWTYGTTQNFETDILDFAPEWIWEIADKHGLIVILHLSHDSESLNHPMNAQQIRYICKKYPNAKMQLAHCAMGHNPYMFKKGLKNLEGLDNVYLDLSGIGEALTFIYALRDFDRKKLLYGTDGFNFGYTSLGRCMGIGKGFLGLHRGTGIPAVGNPGEVDSPYRFGGLTAAAEGLLALFAAGDIVGLTEEEWEDIFYNNAANLMYPIMREE